MTTPKYLKGICVDGEHVMCNGETLTIDEVVLLLNEAAQKPPGRIERLADHLKHYRGLPPYNDQSDLYQDEYFIQALKQNYTPEEFLHAEVLLLPAKESE